MQQYSKSVIRTLYFRFKAALIDNNQKEAKLYYGLLSNCYVNHKDLMSSVLSEYQKSELKRLSQDYKNRVKTYNVASFSIEKEGSEVTITEREMNNYLAHNEDLLRRALDEPKLRVVAVEYPVRGGRCDLIARSENTLYPIELKAVKADYKILGQIITYCNFYEKASSCGLWEKTVGVTIAPDYTDEVLAELQKHNIKPLFIKKSKEGYDLKGLTK